MNYEVIGSIGFAQVGTPEYFEKEQVEVLVLQEIIDTKFKPFIPKRFLGRCHFYIKTFRHDAGSYKEIVLAFDDAFLDKLTDEFNKRFDMLLNLFEKQTGVAFEDAADNNLADNKFYKAAMKITDKVDEFWNFVNECESFDFEAEEYMNKCEALYLKSRIEIQDLERKEMKIIHKMKREPQPLKKVD